VIDRQTGVPVCLFCRPARQGAGRGARYPAGLHSRLALMQNVFEVAADGPPRSRNIGYSGGLVLAFFGLARENYQWIYGLCALCFQGGEEAWMKDKAGEFGSQISAMAKVEEQIAVALAATASQIARAECFDAEQRSEIYAILGTMKADSEAHRHLVGRWVNDRTGRVTDV